MAAITAFTYKKKLNYPVTSLSLSASQSSFPICVHINSTSWATESERDHLDDSGTTGKRVQFFDYLGTTNLPYEVEYYASSAGITTEAVYWVKVPSVVYNSDTNNYIWIAYGNDPNSSDQDQATSVWDSNFKGVWHLGDNSWGSSPEAKDSTSNANNGTNSGSTDATGQVRRGRYFTTDDGVNCGTNSSLQMSSYVTVSAWFKGTFAGEFVSLSRINTGSPFNGYGIGRSTKALFFIGGGGYDTQKVLGTSNVNDDVWHHIAGKYNGSNGIVVVDGIQENSQVRSNGLSSIATFYIGRDNWTYYAGSIDEVRVSNIARSNDWLRLEYYSMKKTAWNGDSYWTWSAEESTGGGTPDRHIIIVT